MYFTESNKGDKGANEKQNIMFKFLEGDRAEQGITNPKVNVQTPRAKLRGAESIILDVTNLKLDPDQKLQFFAAPARYYESNFWIQFKSLGFVAWMALVLA